MRENIGGQALGDGTCQKVSQKGGEMTCRRIITGFKKICGEPRGRTDSCKEMGMMAEESNYIGCSIGPTTRMTRGCVEAGRYSEGGNLREDHSRNQQGG